MFTQHRRIKADLTLLLVAVIWGSAFVVQRIAAPTAGVFLFNGLRFLFGGLVLLPFSWPHLNLRSEDIKWYIGGGSLLFAAGGFQQAGLQFTTAGNAAFITSLYVVFVPVALWLIWRRPVRLLAWVSAGLAVVGVLLLSAQGTFQLAPGDGLELAGSVLWAFHVILVGSVVRRLDVLAFSTGQFFVAGLLNLISGSVIENSLWPEVIDSMGAVLYTGVLSVGVGYTLQAQGQKHTVPTDAAILLSMESVFAAVFGFLFLSERLNLIQIAGSSLIFAAILLTIFKGQRVE